MKAKNLDKKFDEGKDISKDLDLSKARRPLQAQKRANVDFPIWMIESLDKEAARLGVTRQSIIKVWLSENYSKGLLKKNSSRPQKTRPAEFNR